MASDQALPPPATPPISAKRLNRIAAYLDRRFDSIDVLARHEVQYGLSETGPPHVRLDPRELEMGLHFLGNNPNPGDDLPHGPWEPQQDIYVSPRIARTGSKSKAGILAATRAEQIAVLAQRYPNNRAVELGNAIANSIDGSGEVESCDDGRTESLIGAVEWSTAGARFRVGLEGAGRSTFVWVTSNVNWLFPDDPGLWKHLSECVEKDVLPIVIARKAPISTFTLLKRLGGFGLQLHHLFLPGRRQNARVVARALNAVPPVIRAPEVAVHTAVGVNLPAAIEHPPPKVDAAADAIGLGHDVGLGDPSYSSPEALHTWLKRTELDMPQPWKAQLTRYLRWSKYVNRGADDPR